MLYLCSVVLLLLSVFFFLYVVQIKLLLFSGADPGFFLGGGALVSSNKPHSFFLQNTSCIRKPQVISGGGAHPLHPPPRSAPGSQVLISTHRPELDET